MSVKTKIELDGPFFTRDPGKTLRGNVKKMLDGLTSEALPVLRNEVRPLSDTVAERVDGGRHSQSGREWGVSAQLNVNTVGLTREEAIRTKAIVYGRRNGNHGQTIGIEAKGRPFKRMAQAIRRLRAVVKADLTKGLE